MRLVSLAFWLFSLAACAGRQQHAEDSRQPLIQRGYINGHGQVIQLHEEDGCHPATFPDVELDIRARFQRVLEGEDFCGRRGYDVRREEFICRSLGISNRYRYIANMAVTCRE